MANITDKQVKEIISSYPPEDLFELLNYDQKEYIKGQLGVLAREELELISACIIDRQTLIGNAAHLFSADVVKAELVRHRELNAKVCNLMQE